MYASMPTTDCGYTFTELDEPARRHALRNIQQTRPCRWDPDDAEHAAAVMATALATNLDQPRTGRSWAGQLDVEVTVWDARRFDLAGVLHPDTATTLPWTPTIVGVSLGWRRRIHVHTTSRHARGEAQRMRAAVHAAITRAWRATHRQLAHRLTLEWVATFQPRFTAAGHLSPPPTRN